MLSGGHAENALPQSARAIVNCRMLRRAGIPVYGVSGMFTDADDVRAHGKDEPLGVKEFYGGVDFTYRFIKALSRMA
jgi:acetylornithine deacetylase/succinyl-diaminopimelate desuccinylase-like protein